MADINTNSIDFDGCATDNTSTAGSSQITTSASSSISNSNGSGMTKAEAVGGTTAPWEHQDVLLSNAGLSEANPLLDFGEMEDDFQKMLNDWENHIGIGPTTLPHVSLGLMYSEMYISL